MWAVTTYFNFAGYKSKIRNYNHFRSKLNIPLLTVEFSLDGKFELTDNDADILIQIAGGALLWQKESLLNIAVSALPKNVENVAWIDCDILFENIDWHIEAKNALEHQKIVQLFSHALYLENGEKQPSNSKSYKKVKGSIFAIKTEGKKAHLTENEHSRAIDPIHPGFAWAAKRDLVDKNKLYDKAIIGGGDSLLVCALLKEHHQLSDVFGFTKGFREDYASWAEKLYESTQNKIGFVTGTVYHLWHGDLKNRKYFQRYSDLFKLGFDPNLDVRISSNGAINWKRPRPDLEQYMSRYFVERKEDD